MGKKETGYRQVIAGQTRLYKAAVKRFEKTEEILTLFYEEYLKLRKMQEKKHLMEIIKLREEMVSEARKLLSIGISPRDERVQILYRYSERCAQILEDQDVEIYTSNRGDLFDPERHKGLERLRVSDTRYDRRIIKVHGDGYIWNGIVLKKVTVTVGILQ